jgi:formylglycine-generating enzyme required for sulfatase activity
LIVTSLLFTSTTRAEVTFQWATVGDAGNAADEAPGDYGAVATPYLISKHEVTNAQYVDFLNAKDATGANTLGLYNSEMTTFVGSGGINFAGGNASGSKYSVKPGQGSKPVTFVSWYDSARFTNWLNNGQGSGDTESGAYTLIGGTPTPSNGLEVARNPGARVFLPSEDEWYKAAYYKGGGTNAGYWEYPTQSDAVPISDQPPGAFAPANSANYLYDDGLANGYNDGWAVTGSPNFSGGQNYLTDVGAYTASVSAYGTFDQAGNVSEWNGGLVASTFRGFRGGSWANDAELLPASFVGIDFPYVDDSRRGFRVAGSVPEPGCFALMCLGLPALLRRATAAAA